MDETPEQLKEQIEAVDPEMEKVLKRAMLTKDLGNQPAMLMLKQTLAQRIDLCKRYIVQKAKDMPLESEGVLRYAVETSTIATRMASYEWFLKLFTTAEARVAVINNDLGGRRRK